MFFLFIATAYLSTITIVNCGCVCDTKSPDDVCADDWSRTKYLFAGCKRIEYGIPLPCEKIPHICRTVALVQPVTEVQLPCGLIKCEAILALPDHFRSNNGCCKLISPKSETESHKHPSQAGLAIGLTLGILPVILMVVFCIVSFSLKLKWTVYLRLKLSNMAGFHQRNPLINDDGQVEYQSDNSLTELPQGQDGTGEAKLKLTLRQQKSEISRIL